VTTPGGAWQKEAHPRYGVTRGGGRAGVSKAGPRGERLGHSLNKGEGPRRASSYESLRLAPGLPRTETDGRFLPT